MGKNGCQRPRNPTERALWFFLPPPPGCRHYTSNGCQSKDIIERNGDHHEIRVRKMWPGKHPCGGQFATVRYTVTVLRNPHLGPKRMCREAVQAPGGRGKDSADAIHLPRESSQCRRREAHSSACWRRRQDRVPQLSESPAPESLPSKRRTASARSLSDSGSRASIFIASVKLCSCSSLAGAACSSVGCSATVFRSGG